jgi:hypothetical protein
VSFLFFRYHFYWNVVFPLFIHPSFLWQRSLRNSSLRSFNPFDYSF